MESYDEIGRLSVDYFNAEKERIKTMIKRAKARDSHNCDCHDIYEPDTGYHESKCYHSDLPFVDWCDNCKFVQPYHIDYIAAAKKARIARYKMTRRIKRLIEKGGK